MTQDTFVNGVMKQGFYDAIGARIAERREAIGLSRHALADAAKVSVSTINHAEDGTSCSVLVLARIAEVLDCLMDELVEIGSES